jgi:transposase
VSTKQVKKATAARMQRRKLSAQFKAQVALEALRGEITMAALCAKHKVHANQVSQWKQQLVESAAQVFGAPAGAPAVDIGPLHAKIGELTLENDFLEKALTKAGLLSAAR